METRKRLVRSQNGSVVRILFVFFAFAGGPAVLVYLVLWAVMPQEAHDDEYDYYEVPRKRKNEEEYI